MRPFGDFDLDIRTIGTGIINVIPHSEDDCVIDHTVDYPYPTMIHTSEC